MIDHKIYITVLEFIIHLWKYNTKLFIPLESPSVFKPLKLI